jgi:hypothetical protein
MTNTFILRAAKVPTEFKFQIRTLEDNGGHGVFNKKVDAVSLPKAWLQVVREMSAMKALIVVSITYI